MKRKLLTTVSICLCLLLSACSGGTSEKIQQETGKKEDSGQQEIELSMDNVNDYIDFVSIGKSDNEEIEYDTYNWILINKVYEDDIILINDNFTIRYEQTHIDFNSKEKMRISDYGSHHSSISGTRAEYFNEYPY